MQPEKFTGKKVQGRSGKVPWQEFAGVRPNLVSRWSLMNFCRGCFILTLVEGKKIEDCGKKIMTFETRRFKLF